MTLQSPRIYLYKITFEEVPYYYYGVHKEKKFDEYYVGTPVTHKWCWDFYTPKKQILQLFDFTDKGWIEAQEVEKILIKPFYNIDKWCLNENVGGVMSLNACKLGGKIVGKKMKKDKRGIHALTFEQRSENGKITGKVTGLKHKENMTGVCGMTSKECLEAGRKGGTKTRALDKGIYARTKNEMQEHGRKNGLKSYENGTGIHSLTPKQKSELGKMSCSQKWMCLETGFIANPGNLSKYQKAKGIDTSKRKRISQDTF